MKVCVCDDIIEYRISIIAYAEQYFIEKGIEYEIDEFTSPSELLNSSFKKYDLFFLDIEFGENTNGIDLIHELQKNCENSFFIIVTAYRKYLDEAMDLAVLRFIDKPVQQERIYLALDKALDVLYNSIITIECVDGNTYRINKRDIIYAEASMKKSTIITTRGNFICPLAFKYVKDQLGSSNFLIPHNSFIVNKNYISTFNRTQVTLEHQKSVFYVPISATKQRSFKDSFNRY